MAKLNKTSTTNMKVTSIRFEQELLDGLRQLAGNEGYQGLIRNVLWNYVQHNLGNFRSSLLLSDIRYTTMATANKDESCALTGKLIREGETMLIAQTIQGETIPLCLEALDK